MGQRYTNTHQANRDTHCQSHKKPITHQHIRGELLPVCSPFSPLLSGCIIILSVAKKKKRSQRIWICVYICLPLICMPESTSQHKANFLAICGMAGGGNEYSLWICFILRGGDTSWACRYLCLLSLCPSCSFSASLRCWEPSLLNLMSLIRL